MPIKNKIIAVVTLTTFIFSAGLIAVPEAKSITIQEERELAREFMEVVKARYPLIKDPIIVDYVNQVGQRILAAMPPQPYEYRFHVLKEDTYNAFATPAGNIFFNSGLFAALESEEELASILGHEIAHVVCRHISQRIEQQKKIGMATLAGMVAGVLLGAGGAAEAASAVTVGSMAAGQTATLAYSRKDERQADQLGLDFLTQAGYSGVGLLTSLKKIRSKQWYGSNQVPTYLTTHPGSEERMSYIDNWLHQHRDNQARARDEVGGYDRVHTRIVALYTDPDLAVKRYRSAVKNTPDDALAQYGYALALTRKDEWDLAAEHMQRAIEGNALATHMLQDLGQIYFHGGRYDKAMQALSASNPTTDPKTQFYLGRTQMELGRLAAARDTFENLVRYSEDYTQAYYYLGESSGRLGDMFGAHYNLGLYYQQKEDMKNAEFHLKRALKLAANESQKQMVERQLKALSHPGKAPLPAG